MTDLYEWITAFGLFAKWFHERWYFTQPLTAIALSIVIGPVRSKRRSELMIVNAPKMMSCGSGKALRAHGSGTVVRRGVSD